MKLRKPEARRSGLASPGVYAHEAYAAAPDNTSVSTINKLPSPEEDKPGGVHKEALANVVGDMLAAAAATAAATRDPRVVAASTIIVGTRSVQTNCLSCHNGN